MQSTFPIAIHHRRIISHADTARIPHTRLAAAPHSRQAIFGHKVVKLNFSQHRGVIHVQPTMFQPNNALLMMSAVR